MCIDMTSSAGLPNFCAVTGQPDWCSSSMACDGGGGGACKIQNWCVCQWAFAAYLERAGGCDSIQEVVCEATNMVAYSAYRHQVEAGTASDSIVAALSCLESRCGIKAIAAVEA